MSDTILDEVEYKDSALDKSAIKESNKRKFQALLLMLPLLIFVLVFFIIPVFSILSKSVNNPEVYEALPKTAQALSNWNEKSLPDELIFKTLGEELILARKDGKIAAVAKRISYEDISLRRIILKVPRVMPPEGDAIKTILIKTIPELGEIRTWKILKSASNKITPFYLLSAFDLEVNHETGDIKAISEDKALYFNVLLRTIWMAFVVTALCVLFGYPLSYWLSKQPKGRANLFMIFVLLPFWTSLIVRTASWMVLLQNGGIINQILMGFGIIEQPLQLVFNRIGVYISMTHILLPFIILPLHAVMRGISPQYVRAAISLGAHPFSAFWKVYIPQTYTGVMAGALLVFMMSIGYYITPSLLGGPKDQMVSYFIAYFMNTTMNWGMAAALGVQLLVIVLILYVLYSRINKVTPNNS